MPGYSEIHQQVISQSKSAGSPEVACNIVRQQYMKKLADLRNANVILYASCFTQKSGMMAGIVEGDVNGLMNVLYGLKPDKDLELILHSPGGLPEAAEGMIDYLHAHFSERKIRVIVPRLAMSAATMMACAADVIVMGKHSSLGPIDPQITVQTPSGLTTMVPARAVIDEFLTAKQNAAETFWFLRMRQYSLGQIQECLNREEMSKKLVELWLTRRMLAGRPEQEARDIAQYLGNHDGFKSHGRKISPYTAKEKGLKVEMLEDTPEYQDMVLSIFHAAELTFMRTSAVKIIENHNSRVYITG